MLPLNFEHRPTNIVEVYFLSIFIYNSKESDEENTRIIAEISKEIYNFITQN